MRRITARHRLALTMTLLAIAVPAAVTAASGPAAAARPTCTTWTEEGGALLPATASGDIDCSLRRGDRGAGVKRLQQTLVECYRAGIATDSVFGGRTEEALRKAQSAAGGIKVDGVYGPETRRAMKHPYLGDSPCGRVTG